MRRTHRQAGRIALWLAAAALLMPCALRGQVTSITASGDQAVRSGTKGAVGVNPVKLGVNYSVDPATGTLGIRLNFPVPGGTVHCPLSTVH